MCGRGESGPSFGLEGSGGASPKGHVLISPHVPLENSREEPVLKFWGQMSWPVPLLSQVAGKRSSGSVRGDLVPRRIQAWTALPNSLQLLPQSLPQHGAAPPSPLPVGYLLPLSLFFSQILKPPRGRAPPRAVSTFPTSRVGGGRALGLERSRSSLPGTALSSLCLGARGAL